MSELKTHIELETMLHSKGAESWAHL